MEQYIENLEEEVRCGHTVSRQMKEVWNIQLNMATCLLDVCKRHSLKIWGVSGTMLGAVRHKGFIPWDDDMDFIMPREDYDRLQSFAKDEFSGDIFFQSPYTEKGYYRAHTQIRWNNSAMILPHEADKGYNFNQGIFIDIFPLDGFPGLTKELQEKIELKTRVLVFLWTRHYSRNWVDIKRIMSMIKTGLKLGKKAFWKDKQLYSYVEDLFREYKIESYPCHCASQFAYAPRWVREKEWFDETVYLPFEKIMLPVPSKYHEALTREYGDYMVLVKNASCHGNDLILDTRKNYSKYIKKKKRSHLSIFLRSIHGVLHQIINPS